ncbi:hypothetical protein ACN4EE_07815 [Geminocystis sp. CENA526]|uniref:hypothetical protein n=1 Tax=Geminocystis sp. CENA526 TaxID=1355871 RepID=UPI003D6E6B5B
MIVTKTIDKNASNRVVPLMAAFPYKIQLENTDQRGDFIEYNPALQYTIAGSGSSTSSFDESAGRLDSIRDTKQDD